MEQAPEFIYHQEWLGEQEDIPQEAYDSAVTKLAAADGDIETLTSTVHHHGEDGNVAIFSVRKKEPETPAPPKPVTLSDKSLNMLNAAIEDFLSGKSVVYACADQNRCIPTYNKAVENIGERIKNGEKVPNLLFAQLNARIRQEKKQNQLYFVTSLRRPAFSKVDAVFIDPEAKLTKEQREEWLARKIKRNLEK